MNHVVIMAGGIGSRFWPMSTPEMPKQFIDIFGNGRTLIQMTVDRFQPICSYDNMWIVTGERYVDIVKRQLPEIPTENILAEPEARNTAPCIAYACWKIKEKDANANITVTPSDALVINTTEYQRLIKSALDFTTNNNNIVTIGITPTRPETGYGYIKSIPNNNDFIEIQKVETFKEKPDLTTAQKYLSEGCYYWNSGIFVWNVNTITSSIREYAPQIANVMDEMAKHFNTAEELDIVQRLFPTCEKISIDYAVMEKSPNIYTLPGSFGWSDLGSWGSLHANLPHDSSSNAIVGNKTVLYESSGCIVHTSLKRVAIQGLNDYIIAEKDGQLLICKLSEEQRIREFSNE